MIVRIGDGRRRGAIGRSSKPCSNCCAAGSGADASPDLFPPMTTVKNYFYRWREIGLCRLINHRPLRALRNTLEHEASPSVGALDSQSGRTRESGSSCGCDAGKRSRAGSAISSPLPKASSSAPWSTPPTWRIAIVDNRNHKTSDRTKGFDILPGAGSSNGPPQS